MRRDELPDIIDAASPEEDKKEEDGQTKTIPRASFEFAWMFHRFFSFTLQLQFLSLSTATLSIFRLLLFYCGSGVNVVRRFVSPRDIIDFVLAKCAKWPTPLPLSALIQSALNVAWIMRSVRQIRASLVKCTSLNSGGQWRIWLNSRNLTADGLTLNVRHKRPEGAVGGWPEEDEEEGRLESHVSFAATKCVLPATSYP